MSRELNWRRAAREWAAPCFQALPQQIKDLWEQTIDCTERLGQIGNSTAVGFQSTIDEPQAHQDVEELERAFNACDPDELAEGAAVIDRFGYWSHVNAIVVHYPGLKPKRFECTSDAFSPGREAKSWAKQMDAYPPKRTEDVRYEYERVGPSSRDTVGAHWKFAKLVATNLIAREEWNVDRQAERVQKRLGFDDESFMDHKPGTSWAMDEMPFLFREHFDDAFEVEKGLCCNFKPHPFTIGSAHFKSDSMYLRAETAPCAYREGRGAACGLSHDQHTHDTVLVLKILRDVPNKEAAELLTAAQPLRDEHGIDGVVFLESAFKILPVEEEDGIRDEKANVE